VRLSVFLKMMPTSCILVHRYVSEGTVFSVFKVARNGIDAEEKSYDRLGKQT
jgi:hypothetical protein